MNRRALCGFALLTFAAVKSSFASAVTDAVVGGSTPERQMPSAKLVDVSAADRRAYETFKRRFIMPDGRVIDTFNGGESHSEGQGWGLMMAVAFDDPATFERIHHWTRTNLRRPSDNLHAWRFEPGMTTQVADGNNATDGDLYIAGALARGARAWNRQELATDAAAIGNDILALLVRRVGDRLVLLPGSVGFDNDGVILNLSYYAFPFMQELAGVAPSPLWATLQADGIRLIEDAHFGPWDLPPDWLRLDPATDALSPAPNWPARFSYDAIRIPLNLAWGGLFAPRFSAAFAKYWSSPQPCLPAWANLMDGAIASYPAEGGTRAIACAALSNDQTDAKTVTPSELPDITIADGYYSSALIVLARIAMNDKRKIVA